MFICVCSYGVWMCLSMYIPCSARAKTKRKSVCLLGVCETALTAAFSCLHNPLHLDRMWPTACTEQSLTPQTNNTYHIFIKYLNYLVTWVKGGDIWTFYPKAQRGRVSRSPKGPLPAGKTNSFSLLCTCDYGCTMSVYSVHMIWTHRLSALREELWLTVCYFSFSHHLRIWKLQIQIFQAAKWTLLYSTLTKTFIIKSYQSCLIIKQSQSGLSYTHQHLTSPFSTPQKSVWFCSTPQLMIITSHRNEHWN